MVLNVRFILGDVIFLLGGNLCSQCVCVVSFMTNKLPCSNSKSTFSLVCLCLNANFRSAPKLNEPMAPSFFKSLSPSLCQAIPSSPLWYRLSKQELKRSPILYSIEAFSSNNSSVHNKAYLLTLE